MKETLRQSRFQSIVQQGVVLLCFVCIMGCAASQSALRKPEPKAPRVEVKPASIDLPEAGVSLPIEIVKNIPIVQLPVGDPNGLWYIVDTGTSCLVLSPEYARQQRLKISGDVYFTAGGRRLPRTAVGIEVLDVGGVNFLSFDAVVMPLSGLKAIFDREITGVLGMALFNGLRVTIDYPRSEMRIEHASDAGAISSQSGKSTIPFRRLDAELIAIPIEIDRQEAYFMLDTGLEYAFRMSYGTAAHLGIERDQDKEITTQTFHGSVRSAVGQLVSPAWIDTVGINQGKVQIHSGRQIVGGDFLRHFSVTIDTVTDQVEFRLPEASSDRVIFRER